MSNAKKSEITLLLARWDRAEHPEEQLFSVAYAELRDLAGSIMRRERRGHTLQPTALVHEAYLRLVDQAEVGWEGRAHFFGCAARAMRQVLVDYARRRQAEKRGGKDAQRVTLHEELQGEEAMEFEILALDEALTRLAELDDRMRRVVEMKIFGGLTSKEIAHALGVSKRTVDGDWLFAKKWLVERLR